MVRTHGICASETSDSPRKKLRVQFSASSLVATRYFSSDDSPQVLRLQKLGSESVDWATPPREKFQTDFVTPLSETLADKKIENNYIVGTPAYDSLGFGELNNSLQSESLRQYDDQTRNHNNSFNHFSLPNDSFVDDRRQSSFSVPVKTNHKLPPPVNVKSLVDSFNTKFLRTQPGCNDEAQDMQNQVDDNNNQNTSTSMVFPEFDQQKSLNSSFLSDISGIGEQFDTANNAELPEVDYNKRS